MSNRDIIKSVCPYCDAPVKLYADADLVGERYQDCSTWNCTKCKAQWNSNLDEMEPDEYVEWQITDSMFQDKEPPIGEPS